MLRGASRPLLSWLAGALGALPRLPAVHSACDRLASAQDASASASLSFHSLVRRLTAGSPARGGGPSWSGTTDGSFWRALSSQAAVSRLASAQARQKRLQAARRQRQSQPSQAPASPPPAAAASAGPAVVPPGSTAGITASTSKATDVQLDRAVGHPALIVTRDIEWGTVIFGFEQANKYTVYDQDGSVVALMAEDMTGIGNEIGRQLLRTRRSFTATVLSADGSQVLFRVRRPAYLISSTMYVEDAAGDVIGEVHRRWHLLQRNYDLYLHKRQFATIQGNFLAWEFELKDSAGGTLALIDRNFQGFAKELFTDAGKYVVHLGSPPEAAARQATETVRQRSGRPDAPSVPPITSLAKLRTDVQVISTTAGGQLAVARPLQLTERLVALAAAISIDYDFFSQHSRSGGGFFGPPLILPVPMPGGGAEAPPADATGGAAAGAAAGAADTAGGGDAGSGGGAWGGGSGQQAGEAASPLERDLGGDGVSPSSGGWGPPPPAGDDGELKWDLPGSGSGDADGDGGGGGGIGGVLGTLWRVFGGGDD